jgi:VCBS repeat-containing protein
MVWAANSTDLTYSAAAGYMQQDGTYGTLYIKADGAYVYKPDTDANNIGEQDVFNYTLSQADGDTASAALVIGIADPNYQAPTLLSGSASGETLSGTAGSDVILGQGGDDILFGGLGDDRLEGGLGNDTLSGGDGNDLIIGGKGNDILSGDAGIDTFVWTLNDQGSIAAPSVDTIKDFNVVGGDKLSLQGLLVGDHSNLGDFLKFEQIGNKLTLQVDHDGSTADNAEFHATQTIVFDNYSSTEQLATDLSVAADSGSAELISKMIADGKLIID